MRQVLIINQDLVLARKLGTEIDSLGLRVLWARDGREAIRLFVRHAPDAVLLSDSLPDISVWDTAELIRSISDVPMLFLAKQADRLSRNRALQLGDEYLTPPWHWDRLRVRLAALMRRAPQEGARSPDPYDDGYLVVDLERQNVSKAGQPLSLTRTEYRLLSCFVTHPNQTLSHSDLLESVWGYNYDSASAAVTLYVYQLRRKIEADPARPTYLQPIRSIG